MIAGATTAWPIAAHAQQAMPMVGFFHTGEAANFSHLAAAFRQGLADAGYVEGRTVAFEYRWGDSQYDRLPALAADLVSRNPAVIFAAGPAWRARGQERHHDDPDRLRCR
jgi:putative ABC transport system substrate-binding protein